jgi:hypothetical protein
MHSNKIKKNIGLKCSRVLWVGDNNKCVPTEDGAGAARLQSPTTDLNNNKQIFRNDINSFT